MSTRNPFFNVKSCVTGIKGFGRVTACDGMPLQNMSAHANAALISFLFIVLIVRSKVCCRPKNCNYKDRQNTRPPSNLAWYMEQIHHLVNGHCQHKGKQGDGMMNCKTR